MATLVENVLSQITQVAERIVEVTASANPDYSVAGRSISKGTYLTQLREAQRDLMEQLQLAYLIESGPFEIRSRGIT